MDIGRLKIDNLNSTEKFKNNEDETLERKRDKVWMNFVWVGEFRGFGDEKTQGFFLSKYFFYLRFY